MKEMYAVDVRAIDDPCTKRNKWAQEIWAAPNMMMAAQKPALRTKIDQAQYRCDLWGTTVWSPLQPSFGMSRKRCVTPRKTAAKDTTVRIVWSLPCLEIWGSQVQDLFLPLVEIVPGSPWFNFSAALVNS